ncbi:motility associated factor glycosyltransferase family protein [Corallincola platygyrae]|uniref:Motility associated factor glycosyltransferase family protein n=1 Tax=Corallincola platygyrae TaxID=1193278 RepID=A0ABW4XIG1_9GAMM
MAIQVDKNSLNLLRQVLNLTFTKNLAFLKERFPHLAEKFETYKPKSMGLEMDPMGRLNICGAEGFIYDGDPKQVCEEQAKQYFDRPVTGIYRLSQQGWEASMKLFRHANLLKELVDMGEGYAKKAVEAGVREPYHWFPFFTVLGVGIGYHLEKIQLQADKIGHLFIYEPNDDLFYASLHVTDYRQLFDTFTSQNKGITLLVGCGQEEFVHTVQKVMFKIGIFKSCALPIYRHYDSKTADESLRRFFDNLSNFYAGFGFFEDEVISTRHTMKNMAAGCNLMANDVGEHGFDRPVFICANGPSIDYSLDYIKQHRDEVIVISCGTALKTLHNAGIKPHIHIEIERVEYLADWIREVDPQGDYLKDIHLVGMNTLSPGVVSQFKEATLFFKPNDVGTELARVTLFKDFAQYLHLFNSNPTVSNAAMALAIHFKAPQVYLFGVDVGYVDPEYHHSKASAYYGQFKGVFEKGGSGAHKRVKGNFRDMVSTSAVFDWCRHVLELVIRIKGEGMEFFNTSDGARIEGATPCKIEDISLPEAPETPFDSDQWIAKARVQKPVTFEMLYDNFRQRQRTIRKLLNFLADDDVLEIDWAENDVFDLFQRNHLQLRKHVGGQDNPSVRMIEGSMTYLQITILGYMHMIPNNDLRNQFVTEGIELFVRYFKEMKTIFKGLEKELEELALKVK